jgi:hypothetical protein
MPAVNLRQNAYHAQETIGEIQYLVDLASSTKEEFDYTLEYLKNQIVRIGVRIQGKRESLIAFMGKYGIDYSVFPIMNQILADDVIQDTAPVQNLSAVAVEDAMRKNIPDETFNHLRNKLDPKVAVELNDRIDEIKKMKLHKAWLERSYTDILIAKKEYEKNEAEQGESFQLIRKDLEDQIALHTSLSEFKYMFSNTPAAFTSTHLITMQDSKVDRYCSIYVAKKKSIMQQADKIQANYEDVSRYSETGTQIDFTFLIDTMTSISKYFGEPSGAATEGTLPAQYVDAYQKKQQVIKSLDIRMSYVATFVKNIKAALDAIRKVTGLGNKEIEGIFTQAIEISRSPVNARNMEQTTLTQIKNQNTTVLSQAQNKVENVKGVLQRGVDALDDAFVKAQKDLLLKMSLNLGFPVTSVKDRNQNLEDHVREKVRKKFGNIPFEDEEVIIENGVEVFVKKSDIDPKTKLRKTTVAAASLVERASGIRRR